MAALERLRIDLARFEAGDIRVEQLEASLREADRVWRIEPALAAGGETG
jgi:hypothetical protein